MISKIIKLLKNLKKTLNNLKQTKTKDNTYDNVKPFKILTDNMSTKDNESSSSDDENEYDEKPRRKHEKSIKDSDHLHLDSEIDSRSSYGGTTYTSTKYHVYNDDLKFFDHETVLSLQNIHFSSNVIKFVLGSIPKFENIIER